MKTWVGHIRNLLRSPGGKDTIKGLAGAGLTGFAAPIASRSFTGEDISPEAQALSVGLGGAAFSGRLGRGVSRLAAGLARPAALAVATDGLQRHYQGYSSLDPNSIKAKARKLIGDEVHAAADRYLPQSALPDGTTHRTLSPEGRAAVDKLLGSPELSAGAKSVVSSPQVKQMLDGLGFQYSSLHGLNGWFGCERSWAAYLQGRDRSMSLHRPATNVH